MEESKKIIWHFDPKEEVGVQIGRWLESAGYAGRYFADGNDLISALGQSPDEQLPQIFLVEVDPNHSVIKAIKNNPRTSKLPIVVLSTLGEDIDVTRAWQAGCDTYLLKPIGKKKLLEFIQKSFQSLQK